MGACWTRGQKPAEEGAKKPEDPNQPAENPDDVLKKADEDKVRPYAILFGFYHISNFSLNYTFSLFNPIPNTFNFRKAKPPLEEKELSRRTSLKNPQLPKSRRPE
jgi:hypothetical protein